MTQYDQSSMLSIKHHNLIEFIEHSMETFAALPAYQCLGQTLTFADIESKSAALAAWLQNQPDLSTGDRVAIQLPNLGQYPIAAYAIWRAGMVLVNTNPLYTAPEMQHQYSDCGAKAIIILADMLPKLEQIIDRTDITTIIATNAADLLQPQPLPETTLDVISFNRALTQGSELTLAKASDINSDSIAVIQYTGGTTGVSKGAVLTHNNLLSNLAQTTSRVGENCGDGCETFVTPLPMYHIYAFVLSLLVFSKGNANVLIPNPRDLGGFIKTLTHITPTGFCGINTLFVGLCHHPEINQVDFSQLKLTLSGGAALTSSASLQWLQTTGCQISEGYGLSETSPVVSLNPPGFEQVGTIGVPVLNTELQIWDDAGQQVKRGEAGEIVVRGPQVMQGYWQQPLETRNVLTADGWFKTGDIAIEQNDGFFKIVDRKKDMIIVSGFNVYPNEIEDVLSSHPTIIEAAVIGESCEKTGERVSAYVVMAPDNKMTAEQVMAFCKTQLTAYKIPKKITFMAELPKSTVGKVLRRELRS